MHGVHSPQGQGAHGSVVAGSAVTHVGTEITSVGVGVVTIAPHGCARVTLKGSCGGVAQACDITRDALGRHRRWRLRVAHK